MSGSIIAVAGAGFSGSVVARELAERGRRVVVFEPRAHVAGNCHTERDASTGIQVHRYGTHIFNTDRQDVWDYVNRFGKFIPFTNRVRAVTGRGTFGLPINLTTINRFFGRNFNPQQARQFVAGLGDSSIGEPANFEEQALKFIGRELYEAFFYGYTKKHWGCEPRELPASVLKRLPVRFTAEDSYYDTRYQALPQDGYTEIVRRMLDHPQIEVRLGEWFRPETKNDFERVFYTGPVDAYFAYKAGRLSYRTVRFEREEAPGDYQGNAVVNYCQPEIPYTRIHESKYLTPWEKHDCTVYFHEYSFETGPQDLPYYPKRLATDLERLACYQEYVKHESKVTFLGRLGTYRYLNMDQVIGEALDSVKNYR
jgi:UDP-galactopyranose mutase